MMKEIYNTPNSGCCGRPFPTAPENKCNYNDCCMNEYAYKQKACIREKQPDCEAQAVIPSITVETVDGITNLANCLVHVTSTNTTYYVDDKHRIMITWAGPVDIPGYNMEENPNHYKDQIVTDIESEMAVIYDKHGNGYIFGITNSNLQEAVNKKLDEMAEDGTLEDIIKGYLQEDAYLIFPRYMKLGTDTLGDCTIFKTDTKSIMIDCFSDDAVVYTGITEALSGNSISHLDYFILSHYDGDHRGNVQRLVNDGYITEDTTVILPNEVHNDYIDVSGDVVKNIFTNANIPYILCNNQTFIIDDATVSLCNGSIDDINYLNSQDDRNYNDYSVVTKIIYKDKKMLITGDLDGKGLIYVASNYLNDGPYDILKDCHHGFANFDQTFASKVCPKIVVIPASYGMIEHNLGYRGDLRAYWQNCTSRIYVQGEQPSFLSFKINDFEVKTDSNAISVQQPSTGYKHQYYVDATTNSDIRDGSKKYPFKDLSEAAMMIPKNDRALITICSDLSNPKHVVFQGFSSLYIDFDNYVYSSGDEIINFYDIGFLRIKNYNSTDSRIYCEEVRIVEFNGFSSSRPDNQIYCVGSNIRLTGNFSITTTSDSIFPFRFYNCNIGTDFGSLTFSSSGATLINALRCVFVIQDSDVAKITAYRPFEIFSKSTMQNSLVNHLDEINTLYSSDTAEFDSGDIKIATSDYSKFKVTYTTDDGYPGEVVLPRRGSDSLHPLTLIWNSASSDAVYYKSGMLAIRDGTKKFELTRPLSYTHDLTTGVITTHTDSKYMGVKKIVGIV